MRSSSYREREINRKGEKEIWREKERERERRRERETNIDITETEDYMKCCYICEFKVARVTVCSLQ